MTMMLARAGCIALTSLLLLAAEAMAQPAGLGCTSTPSAQGTQTIRCEKAITIVAENGARFEPKKPGRHRFEVVTPQAIAAVRGTKWAVDAADGKTSVFVVNGSVRVARSAGRGSVVLGAGDGVDVGASGDLTVKRWAAPRVAALMARLGQ